MYKNHAIVRSSVRKLAIGRILLGLASLGPAVAAAELPTGGDIVRGEGNIGAPVDGRMTIEQGSDKLAIDWQQFNIGAGNTVTFEQPGSDAIALNRVLGADGSKIMGRIEANGRVFLINPNGVLFGADAQVNVGGLVASTLDLSNDDFTAGNYRFAGDGDPAAITNLGRITAHHGGTVALLGGQVSNLGIIQAQLGSVALAAGNKITLDFAGDGLLSVQIDRATKNALVENGQLIQADGGQVLMTAKASDVLLRTVVNNTGVIEARTLEHREGRILLLGGSSGGTVEVAGTLNASAPDGGDGGFVETSGAHVRVTDGATVTTLARDGDTGTWLIDPTDLTVSAGDAAGTDSGIGASTLSDSLAANNIELATVATGAEAGDIHVNAAVSWDADTTLTLTAHNDIQINADITATGASGGLALNYGAMGTVSGADYYLNDGASITLSGANASFALNGDAYIVINSLGVAGDTTAGTLQGMSGDLAANYALGSDINASSTATWNGDKGFAPIGSDSNAFTGIFDGLGHTISGLTINRPTDDAVGLFGGTENALIRNIGMEGGSISGGNYVGGLVGSLGGTIRHAYVTGMVSGIDFVGGLVGFAGNGSDISFSYAIGDVTGVDGVGGLIGEQQNNSISFSYATGDVTGEESVGGLVGMAWISSVSHHVYATGNVSGTKDVGGLVGYNSENTISHAYATGDVTGEMYVGGLVGTHGFENNRISHAYATGDVSGTEFVGGLVGANETRSRRRHQPRLCHRERLVSRSVRRLCRWPDRIR